MAEKPEKVQLTEAEQRAWAEFERNYGVPVVSSTTRRHMRWQEQGLTLSEGRRRMAARVLGAAAAVALVACGAVFLKTNNLSPVDMSETQERSARRQVLTIDGLDKTSTCAAELNAQADYLDRAARLTGENPTFPEPDEYRMAALLADRFSVRCTTPVGNKGIAAVSVNGRRVTVTGGSSGANEFGFKYLPLLTYGMDTADSCDGSSWHSFMADTDNNLPATSDNPARDHAHIEALRAAAAKQVC